MKTIIVLAALLLFFYPSAVLARLPDDPFAEQWSYKDIKVYEAWDKTTGSADVVVAVIDDGFDTFHPDLYPNVWKNEDEIDANGIDDDKNGYIDDVWGWDFSARDVNNDGVVSDQELKGNNDPRPWVAGRQNITDDIHHGTLVAGIIGAVGNNNQLGTGINWQVKLMNLKVIENKGTGDLQPLVEALYYAVDNGADVINISLVGDVYDEVKKAIKYAYDKGVAVVAASGNDRVALNFSPVYPICADAGEVEQLVLGVSAIQEDHYLAQFSNTGSSCIDITSPGVKIGSVMRYAPRQNLNKLYGFDWQGTSFAAPFVSGAAALIKSIQPAWGPKQIYQAILSTVHRTPPKDVKAYEDLYGAGLLQINNAVNYAFSQKATTHPMISFSAIDLNTGSIQENKIAENKIETKLQTQFKKVSDLAQYSNGYVIVKEIGRNQSQVFVYNKNWEAIKNFIVSSKGALRIMIGDIQGDEQSEIILAPAYKDKQVLRVFDLNGKELGQFNIANAHNGVSLGLSDIDNNKKEILAVYNYNGQVKLHRIDGNLKLMSFIELPFIKNTGQVVAGDIDGNGLQEYIVAGGAGDVPFLAFYDKEGNQQRKFYGYDINYSGGLNIMAGDYDNDGKDDVLVVPKTKEGSVFVWNNRSKKIATWSFISSGNNKFLPIYR